MVARLNSDSHFIAGILYSHPQTQSNMLFTSAPLTANAKPSTIFKERGNASDSPSSVSDLTIMGLKDEFNELYSRFVSNISSHMMATSIQRFVQGMNGYNYLAQAKGFPSIVSSPTIGLVFRNHNDEQLQNDLNHIGFSKESKGKVIYYRGAITMQNVATVMSLGSEISPYVPFGLTNLEGFSAYMATARILEGALKTIYLPQFVDGVAVSPPSYIRTALDTSSKQTSESGKPKLLGSNKTYKHANEIFGRQDGHVIAAGGVRKDLSVNSIFACVDQNVALWEIDAKHVDYPGLFLPYYDTLLVADKTFVPNFIVTTFPLLLGESVESRAKMSITLKRGWISLGQTPSGILLSHIAFGLQLAIGTGAKPVIVRGLKNREYIGMALLGEKFRVVKDGGHIFKPITKEALALEIENYDGHEALMEQLASILSKIDLNAGAAETVIGEELTSPRLVRKYILARNANMDNALKRDIRNILTRLKFSQTYYDPSNSAQVVKAIYNITHNKDWPLDAPLILTSEAMFTTDILHSILAAFGFRCPAFYDLAGTATIVLSPQSEEAKLLSNRTESKTIKKTDKDKKSKTTTKDVKVFPYGLPVLVMDASHAVESWRRIQDEGTLRYRRNAQGNFSGTPLSLKEGDFEKVSKYLAKYAKEVQQKKKRSRDDDEEEVKRGASAGKRAKKDTEAITDMFETFGLVVSTAGRKTAALERDDADAPGDDIAEDDEDQMDF
uniref:Uncharacterized protein n=1 Tax=Heterobasidion ambi-like virus 15 TaxID=3075969 RepID=A0AA96C2B5_9VIRU|nr:hypothetical protein [Heterobasidion ambi-like virus 15]